MAKYLVTGGAGFLGSNIVEAFVQSGDKVVVYDDFSTGSRRNIQDYKTADVKIVEGDIRDDKALRKAMRGCDFVLHLAGQSSIEGSVKNPQETLDISFQGTLNVLIAARDLRVKRVILGSSCAVYGESPVLPKEETMLPVPYNPYGAGCLMSEELARVFYTTYRLETVSLRIFNAYGPRQNPDAEQGVIGRFCAAALKDVSPTIFGDGKQSRDFVYVTDVIEAFRLACTAPKAEGEVFNIASGSRMSVVGLVAFLGQLLEKEIVPTFKDARSADIRHSLAETVKAQEVLGFRPRISLGEGLALSLRWYRKDLGKVVKVPKKY